MTHFGLLCPTASGHLNPMTTLGYELKQRGHRVTLVGTLDAQPKVLAAGLEFQAIGEVDRTYALYKLALLCSNENRLFQPFSMPFFGI